MPTADALSLIRSPSYWAGTPVSRHLTLADLGRTQVNADYISDLTTPIHFTTTGLTRCSSLPQTVNRVVLLSRFVAL